MKTKKRGLALVALALAVLGLGAMSQTVFAEDYEYAAFPAPTVNVTQIAYEAPADAQTGVNAISIVPGGRVFAPFSGTVTFVDPKYGYVLFQSNDKVRYADGTLAYMTVAFMNDSNIADLYVGQKIDQYKNFYDAGNLVNGKKVKGTAQVNISVFRGKVGAPSVYGEGKYLAYKAFYLSEHTKSVVSYGAVGAGNVVVNGGESDYTGLWTPAPAEVSAKGAEKVQNYMTVSGVTTPGNTLQRGNVFIMRGVINSPTTIYKVRAGVFRDKKGSNAVTAVTRRVNARAYNLAYLDAGVHFEKLAAGKYYYIVKGQNTYGSRILVRKAFQVVGGSSTTAAYPKISNANYPSSTLRYGAVFSIRGTVSSSTRLTRVAVGVYTGKDATGMVTGRAVQLNANSFNIANLDNYVYFNRLSRGSYYYIVTATNSYGTKMLLRKAFRVI